MPSEAVTDQRQSVFLQKLLSDEVHRQIFGELCDKGFPAKLLESYLMVICLSARHQNSHFPPIFKQEEKDLPRELECLADRLDHANKRAFAPSSQAKEPYKKIFELLPNIMRGYAAIYRHIERSADPLRHRQLTGTRVMTIQFMALVESFTGTPNYERIAALLTKGFRVTPDLPRLIGGKPPHPLMPRFFNAEALAKLHRSSADLRPSNLPRHHSAVR